MKAREERRALLELDRAIDDLTSLRAQLLDVFARDDQTAEVAIAFAPAPKDRVHDAAKAVCTSVTKVAKLAVRANNVASWVTSSGAGEGAV